MRNISWPAILIVAWAPSADAQPYSQSMAECAGLFGFAGDYMKASDAAAIMEYGQAAWLNAAIVQGQAEGLVDPTADAHRYHDAKYAEWKAQGLTAVLTQDFQDWIAYCRAFSKHTGINLDPA